MLYPEDLGVALKEWDSVCQALIQGRQIVMLRKGGIHESGGEFELEFRRFLLFPTFLHQDQKMLKDSAQDLFTFSGSEPKTIQISAFADVTDVILIDNINQITAIDAYHVWTPKLLQMRLNYRPENPLYLLLAKVHKLPQPVTIDNHQSYAGCKSWVGLKTTINVKGSTPVLDPPTYQQVRDEIMMRVKSAPRPADE
jgi:hypothetical protein